MGLELPGRLPQLVAALGVRPEPQVLDEVHRPVLAVGVLGLVAVDSQTAVARPVTGRLIATTWSPLG